MKQASFTGRLGMRFCSNCGSLRSAMLFWILTPILLVPAVLAGAFAGGFDEIKAMVSTIQNRGFHRREGH